MNTLILALDGFHSGLTGYGGCTWTQTPGLDKLASDSIAFERFFASRLNLSAIYDILWNSSPHQTQKQTQNQTFATRLAEKGFKTALLSDSEEILEHRGSNGFQIIESSMVSGSEQQIADEFEQTRLFETFASLAGLVQDLSTYDKEFVCWAHIGSMARFWDAPEEYRNRYCVQGDLPPWNKATVPTRWDVTDSALRENGNISNRDISDRDISDRGSDSTTRIPILSSGGLSPKSLEFAPLDDDIKLQLAQTYAGQINVLDDCLSLLVADLQESGLWDKTNIALFSTRGIGLGEHGAVGLEEPTFHTEFARLTGLLRSPVPQFGLKRTQNLITFSDWANTLESWIINPDTFAISSGRNRLLSAEDELRTVQTSAWRYLYDVDKPTAGELFVMPDDRWEVNDTARICENVIQELLDVTEDSELSDTLTNVYH